MSNNTSTLEKIAPDADSVWVGRLTKALYSTEQQEKFLHLQAEVETLLAQLQSLGRVETH